MIKKLLFGYKTYKLMRQAQKEHWTEEQLETAIDHMVESQFQKTFDSDPKPTKQITQQKNPVQQTSLDSKIKVSDQVKAIWEQGDDFELPKISLQQDAQYIASLRKLVFTWDPCEVGAPMVSVATPYGSKNLFSDLEKIFDTKNKEMLATHHLAISHYLVKFLTNAKLQPGKYGIQNTTFKKLASELPNRQFPWVNQNMFHFKNEHSQLLTHCSFRWLIGETIDERLTYGYPTIGVDPKRPYGAFTYFQIDMAKALQWELKQNANGDFELTKAQENQLYDLHFEMLPAIQVFVEHAQI